MSETQPGRQRTTGTRAPRQRWSRRWLVGAAALLAATCVMNRDGIACSLARSDDGARLEGLIAVARERVTETYGSYGARPVTVLALSRPAKFWFGANDYAKTIFTPIRACVVFGPKGLNIDVAAHELVHAEIFERLGFWKRYSGLPVWFDEGAAMQVDRREAYEVGHFGGQAMPALDTLAGAASFYSGSDRRVRFNYAVAKHEVRRLLANAGGPRSLYAILADMRHGAGFQAAVAAAERRFSAN